MVQDDRTISARLKTPKHCGKPTSLTTLLGIPKDTSICIRRVSSSNQQGSAAGTQDVAATLQARQLKLARAEAKAYKDALLANAMGGCCPKDACGKGDAEGDSTLTLPPNQDEDPVLDPDLAANLPDTDSLAEQIPDQDLIQNNAANVAQDLDSQNKFHDAQANSLLSKILNSPENAKNANANENASNTNSLRNRLVGQRTSQADLGAAAKKLNAARNQAAASANTHRQTLGDLQNRQSVNANAQRQNNGVLKNLQRRMEGAQARANFIQTSLADRLAGPQIQEDVGFAQRNAANNRVASQLQLAQLQAQMAQTPMPVPVPVQVPVQVPVVSRELQPFVNREPEFMPIPAPMYGGVLPFQDFGTQGLPVPRMLPRAAAMQLPLPLRFNDPLLDSTLRRQHQLQMDQTAVVHQLAAKLKDTNFRKYVTRSDAVQRALRDTALQLATRPAAARRPHPHIQDLRHNLQREQRAILSRMDDLVLGGAAATSKSGRVTVTPEVRALRNRVVSMQGQVNAATDQSKREISKAMRQIHTDFKGSQEAARSTIDELLLEAEARAPLASLTPEVQRMKAQLTDLQRQHSSDKKRADDLLKQQQELTRERDILAESVQAAHATHHKVSKGLIKEVKEVKQSLKRAKDQVSKQKETLAEEEKTETKLKRNLATETNLVKTDKRAAKQVAQLAAKAKNRNILSLSKTPPRRPQPSLTKVYVPPERVQQPREQQAPVPRVQRPPPLITQVPRVQRPPPLITQVPVQQLSTRAPQTPRPPTRVKVMSPKPSSHKVQKLVEKAPSFSSRASLPTAEVLSSPRPRPKTPKTVKSSKSPLTTQPVPQQPAAGRGPSPYSNAPPTAPPPRRTQSPYVNARRTPSAQPAPQTARKTVQSPYASRSPNQPTASRPVSASRSPNQPTAPQTQPPPPPFAFTPAPPQAQRPKSAPPRIIPTSARNVRGAANNVQSPGLRSPTTTSTAAPRATSASTIRQQQTAPSQANAPRIRVPSEPTRTRTQIRAPTPSPGPVAPQRNQTAQPTTTANSNRARSFSMRNPTPAPGQIRRNRGAQSGPSNTTTGTSGTRTRVT